MSCGIGDGLSVQENLSLLAERVGWLDSGSVLSEQQDL